MKQSINGEKKKRELKVYYETFNRVNSRVSVQFPVIRLCGKWLEDAGFSIGDQVTITCEHHKLTITCNSKLVQLPSLKPVKKAISA